MLDDKDRIFKNLYGQGDFGLEGARKRGSWDGTKAILEKGRDGIINEMKASGQRGRGGARDGLVLGELRGPETVEIKGGHARVGGRVYSA